MPRYNLIEYSNNYSDTSGSLWGFRRDEIVDNANVTNDDNAPSFKYKASIIGNIENNGTKDGVKIAVPLKYLSNFWRSLTMLLINCEVELSLNRIENFVLTTVANANKATFKITDAKLYVPIVTLSIADNAKLSKLLDEGFKRSIYWNKYKVIDNRVVEIADNDEENCLIQVIKESKDCLLLFIIIQKVIIKFLLILLKNIFFQELKQKITTSKLMEETFMISQLMTQLSNTTKSEKYQQDKVMITQLVVY